MEVEGIDISGPRDPKELTNEELVIVYPHLWRAARFNPNCISTVGYADCIKEELLRRLK
jgi:hypothetical protein